MRANARLREADQGRLHRLAGGTRRSWIRGLMGALRDGRGERTEEMSDRSRTAELRRRAKARLQEEGC
jgi:hypothetical protein